MTKQATKDLKLKSFDKKKRFDRKKLLIHFKTYWAYYLMLLPGVVFFIAFKYIPMFGTVIAFQDYDIFKGMADSTWVGLKHFKRLISHDDFYRIFGNTIILGLYKIFFTFPIPIILSVMMNEVRSLKLKKTIQTAVYIPYFISWVIIGALIFDMLGLGGIFNNIRTSFGLDPILVMQKEKYFRIVYVISSIWKEAGWGTVVYLAAISGIAPELYESSMIDGASRFQQMKFITFPLLVPTILTLFLLNIGSFLELGFEQVYSLLTPMTLNVGDIIDTYIYRAGIINSQYSYTTAVGFFQSIIGFVLVFTFNKLANKFSDGGLW